MAIISSRPTVGLAKTRWRRKQARTLEDRAGIIGANIWKIASEMFKHMEKEGFRFGSDRMTVNVITEFIIFQIQLVDRIAHGRITDAQRATLIGATARHLAVTLENNQMDLFGPGEYRQAFIDLINARFEDYAGFEYRDREPGFACLRYLAGRVSDVMAEGDNKWVIEQIMDIQAPEMATLVKRLVDQTMADPLPATADAP